MFSAPLRRIVYRRAFLIVFAIFWQMFLPLQAGDFLNIQRRITEILDQYEGGVVRVKAAVEEPNDSGEVIVTQRVGTGFLISEEGHVLTNASVAYEVDRIWIELDGLSYAADHLGSDPETNVSLLKLMVLPERFSYFRVPPDPEAPTLGTLALAITCPLEFGPSPRFGMVAGHESEFSGRIFPVPYTRVDIPAHPGEGGSPVLDLNGRLIGMIVASLPEVQSSYLLPVRALIHIRDDLLFSGEVKYGWLGIEVEERVEREHGRYVVVTSVVERAPVGEERIREGDKLIAMGAVRIRSRDDVQNARFFYRIGEYVDITLERDGEQIQFPVKVVERPVPLTTGLDSEDAADDLLTPR